MPTARKCQICLDETPYYHIVSRIVRRSFLCGEDPLSGKNYDHRRDWVEERLLLLTSIFAIEISAFVVMSNHTHLVLYVDKKRAQEWSRDEVLGRWHQLHKGTLLTQKYSRGEPMLATELEIVNSTCEVYRNRLTDISWFMRELNEHIAREANKEDQCTGRFWEGRFKSQALLDEKALAACMAYVDLNPVRAKMAKTPESSEHTSIKLRLESLQRREQPNVLQPFVGNPREPMPEGLPFELRDYVELVELTGRILRSDKRGAIALEQSPLLERLGISEESWLELTSGFEKQFSFVAGDCAHLEQYKTHVGQQRMRGMSNARKLLEAG